MIYHACCRLPSRMMPMGILAQRVFIQKRQPGALPASVISTGRSRLPIIDMRFAVEFYDLRRAAITSSAMSCGFAALDAWRCKAFRHKCRGGLSDSHAGHPAPITASLFGCILWRSPRETSTKATAMRIRVSKPNAQSCFVTITYVLASAAYPFQTQPQTQTTVSQSVFLANSALQCGQVRTHTMHRQTSHAAVSP